MSRALVVVILLVAARRARADRAVQVDVDGDVPFSGDELAAALRVRLGDGAPVVIHVVGDGAGDVVIEARGASRVVPLGALGEADAVRMAALVAADLLIDDLAVAPAAPVVLAPPGGAEVHAIAAPLPVRSPRPLDPITIELSGAAASWGGDLASATFAGATLDVTIPRGRWLAAIDVGGGSLVGGNVSLGGGIVRLGGGVRLGAIDLRAGATFAPIAVSDFGGDATVLLGGGASARWRVPVGTSLHVVLSAGVDAFATRTQYFDSGTMIGATPWLAPWLGAGVEAAL